MSEKKVIAVLRDQNNDELIVLSNKGNTSDFGIIAFKIEIPGKRKPIQIEFWRDELLDVIAVMDEEEGE